MNFTRDAAGGGERPAGRLATTRGHHRGRQAAPQFRCVSLSMVLVVMLGLVFTALHEKCSSIMTLRTEHNLAVSLDPGSPMWLRGLVPKRIRATKRKKQNKTILVGNFVLRFHLEFYVEIM